MDFTSSASASAGLPVELILALEKRFIETGSPKDLTLLFGGCPGDGGEGGPEPSGARRNAETRDQRPLRSGARIGKRVLEKKVEAYNLPLGVISQMGLKPIINKPATMDERIFVDEPMKLKDTLLSISLEDRIQYALGYLFGRPMPGEIFRLAYTTASV